MKVRRCNTRRGVLLLVILGVLAMFAMLAIAFVVLTRGAQRTSLTVQRIDQYVDKGADDTHLAALQLFRGPSNPASKIKSHCILEDLYGNDWQTDTLPAATGSICGGQLFEFGGLQNDPPNADATRAPQQYVGCIMTMTTGDYTGWSTRIVGVSHTGDGHLSLQALSFAGGCPESGDEYMINGAPFSGTGLIATGLTPGTPDFSEQANEDYDAVDFQNMFLAAYMPEGIIPSFHRPSLVSYNGEASREVMLRPVAEDHPNFPSIDPVNGPWDVDNDGDGIRDSIWIDIGLPVRSTADGRLYKPLASYLCLDLDGRLNINAHGNWTHVDAAGASSGTSRDDGVPPGLGYGPADISLIPLLGDNQEAAERLSTLLAGDATLEGRYGEGDLAASSDPMPGGTADNATQPPKLADDPLSQNKHFDYPANYADYNSLTTHVPTSYGTPPDLHGTMTVNLDDRGLPYYSLSEETDWQKGRVNNPYEINLSRNSASRGYVTSTGSDMAPSYGLDSPFTPAELERMLRPFDRDAGKLSSRLYRLTDDVEDPRLGQSFLTDRRHLFTTESWSQPCPSVAPPNRADATDYFHVTDIFPEALVSDATNQPIAPEILAGLRMDLNRPFGNGIDDSGSG